MKYISKGLVVTGSTEQRLCITRGGADFPLTGKPAALWINGRFDFTEIPDESPSLVRALEHLQRMQLVEIAEEDAVGTYRALTRCVILPAQAPRLGAILHHDEAELLKWICGTGLWLTMAELVYLTEQQILPEECWFGPQNRQRLVERIYTQSTIPDRCLENEMEHAACRDDVVARVLALLRKKRILLL